MPKVTTKTGVLTGKELEGGVHAYLGVPYAKAPAGPLRWQSPQPLEASDREIDCTEFGKVPMQKVDPVMVDSLMEMSEDCLNLNVWVKNPEGKKDLPVMVFIHGGSYMEGGIADPEINGAQFARRDGVILVNMNYRLNAFGFLNVGSLPGGEEFQDASTCGIQDQIAALKWVHENIAAFGGDPSNVTLFGESCGGGSVLLLCVAPSAKGLFKRAICESGPIQLYNTPETSAPYAKEVMELLGCKTAQELAAVPVGMVQEIVCNKFFYNHEHDVSLLYAPTCDGRVLPKKPLQALKDGAAKDIELMIGTNADEFAYWGLYWDLATQMPDFWHHQAVIHFDGKLDNDKYETAWANAYPDQDPGQRYLEYTNQIGFRVGTDLIAQYQAKYNKVYHYLFKYESKVPGMHSCHALELPFVFDNRDVPGVNKGLTGEVPPQGLADRMQDAWASFARTGDPSNPSIPTWEPYDAENRNTMVMDENSWECKKNINDKNDELLRSAFEECLLEK